MSPSALAGLAQGSTALARAAEVLFRPQWILLLLVALVVSRGITRGELHFYGDETRHAFNGVFFRDFLVDLPLSHPMQYAQEYYAKYPAVAVPHWPPLFHIVEGVFFLVFGLSIWVSRLTVLGFALLGACFWYRIAELYGPRYRAFLTAVILTCMPYILLYERVTMLEVPALAACLGVIYFWLRWLKNERARDLWALAGFTAAAFLISQKAIFLVVLLGSHFLLKRRFRLLQRWDVWAALAAALAVVLPWYVLTLRTLTSFASQRALQTDVERLLNLKILTFYLRKLPDQVGLVLLCLAVSGMAWALLKDARRYGFLLLWPVSAYLCYTLVAEKDPRHGMVIIPPLVYFAVLGLETLSLRRRWGLVTTTVLAAVFVFNALRFERPRIVGIEEVAGYVLSLPESDIVYYQGELNGDFIFFVRKYDPEKRRMVVREKQVVVSQIAFETRPVLRSREQILNFFRTWGIRYAIVEGHDPVPGLKPVWETLKSEQFELLRTFAIQGNDPGLAARRIFVYRYRGELQRSSEPVVIPMMTIRHNIRADLNRLAGQPWPD